MMQPWPGISRGTECSVPIVPGLVRLIVVPAKSATSSLPDRALRTTSSYAIQNWRKSRVSAALMFGTRSCREPSAFRTSIARPRLTCSGWMSVGLPSTSAKNAFISGIALSARTIAKPIRCVKDALPPRPRLRWLLMTIRLSISSLAGTVRTLVAVGTDRLAAMFSAVRAAAPRRRISVASAGTAAAAAGLAAAAARAQPAGVPPQRAGRWRRLPSVAAAPGPWRPGAS